MTLGDDMKKIRESNFELLRCILMFMVVLVHYNNVDMGKALACVVPGTLNYYFVYFMESLSIIGTNGFVLLTGYFSWKKDKVSLRKPFGLLLYVSSYSVLFYVLKLILFNEPFSMRNLVINILPRNWYIVLYIVLTLISPAINIVIKTLQRESYVSLLIIMFLVFSVWPTLLDIAAGTFGINVSGLNTISNIGSANGYSIVNFVLLYMIGAAISKLDLLKYSIGWDVLGYLVCSILICVQHIFVGYGWSYANPLVIVSCVFFFNIFRKLHFSSKWINELSKASLGVFLLHTQYLVCGYAWSKIGVEEVCQGGVVTLAIHMLISCLVTYMLCSLFDIGCRWITKPISKMLDKNNCLKKYILHINEL